MLTRNKRTSFAARGASRAPIICITCLLSILSKRPGRKCEKSHFWWQKAPASAHASTQPTHRRTRIGTQKMHTHHKNKRGAAAQTHPDDAPPLGLAPDPQGVPPTRRFGRWDTRVHTHERAAGSRARTSPTQPPCAHEDRLRRICSVTEADEAPAKGAGIQMKGKVSDRSVQVRIVQRSHERAREAREEEGGQE